MRRNFFQKLTLYISSLLSLAASDAEAYLCPGSHMCMWMREQLRTLTLYPVWCWVLEFRVSVTT